MEKSLSKRYSPHVPTSAKKEEEHLNIANLEAGLVKFEQSQKKIDVKGETDAIKQTNPFPSLEILEPQISTPRQSKPQNQSASVVPIADPVTFAKPAVAAESLSVMPVKKLSY